MGADPVEGGGDSDSIVFHVQPSSLRLVAVVSSSRNFLPRQETGGEHGRRALDLCQQSVLSSIALTSTSKQRVGYSPPGGPRCSL